MSEPPEVPGPPAAAVAPILANKRHSDPSAFTPENLLREARRQKGLAETPVPEVCVLDPDGDMVRQPRATGRAHRDPAWACYHTELYRVTEGGMELGFIGCAVGAPFAVLVAEQLFDPRNHMHLIMTRMNHVARRARVRWLGSSCQLRHAIQALPMKSARNRTMSTGPTPLPPCSSVWPVRNSYAS
jgi:hypothetical protein